MSERIFASLASAKLEILKPRPMDYTQFLQQPGETLRLPYFQRKSVCDAHLTYRLRETLQPGWYQFRKSGRYLTVEAPIEPELEAWRLPRVHGYVMAGRMIGIDFQARLFGFPADLDLPKFTPISAAKWFDGHLLYAGEEFETEVEPKVREAFEDERSIDELKGVTPALAHAFLLEGTQRALAREAQQRAREEAERQELAVELARWQETLEGRISLALSHAGAQLISWRRLGAQQVVVRYRLGGGRFECVVDTESLQILDAGICLSGADEELNLSSLPSAVREAIESGQLHVFRNV
ncbi:MAG TPA: hypothetical protein VNU68_19905 [Verrucomicrobiae bacterium]|nr:hypothetical protein [Verrucomicrobiae bacterium]